MPILGVGRNASDFETCHYGRSPLAFRGPRRCLRGRYVAMLGGSETHGRGVERPFADLVEDGLGTPCVNLGWPNIGVDVLNSDPAITRIASGAVATVLQVPNAINLTTRFYKVHPRRNDRVIAVRPPLRRLYRDVDFTQFTFTRHMLSHLRAQSAERFLQLQAEAAAVWTHAMAVLLDRIDGPLVLLWFSDRSPNKFSDDPCLSHEPALVNADMLGAVSSRAEGVIACATRTERDDDQGVLATVTRLMCGSDNRMLQALPDARAHEQVARSLTPVLSRMLRA